MMKTQAKIRSPGLGSFNWKTHFKGRPEALNHQANKQCTESKQSLKVFSYI